MKNFIPWEIFLSELDSAIIIVVSLILVYDFYRAQNGTLRKLMMGLFSCIAFVYALGLVIIVGQSIGYWPTMTLMKFRWITGTPMAIVMVLFLRYRFFEIKVSTKDKIDDISLSENEPVKVIIEQPKNVEPIRVVVDQPADVKIVEDKTKHDEKK